MATTGKILYAEREGTYVLKFIGDVRVTLCSTLDSFLNKMFSSSDFKTVLVDLTETAGIDSTSLGLLAKLSIEARKRFDIEPTLISTNEDVTRVLLSMGFDEVFFILREDAWEPKPNCLDEVPSKNEPESEVCKKVLEAHQVLMSMNDKNREAFQDLVNTLSSSDFH